jgi:hypothetical protein
MISRALTLLPDERLVQMAAAGSDSAFAALYNRYSGTLFAYCRSITRNAEDPGNRRDVAFTGSSQPRAGAPMTRPAAEAR